METATFWVVAQCLNQLRHRVPRIAQIGNGNYISHNTSTAKVSHISVSVPGTEDIAGRTYGPFGVRAVRNQRMWVCDVEGLVNNQTESVRKCPSSKHCLGIFSQ